jgi:hypothetical protein
MMATFAPAQAVLWQFWWRNRLGFVLGATYILAAAITIQLLPPELRTMSFVGGDRPLIADWLGLPCLFVVMHVLAVFTTSEGGLKDSGISQHTFVLPVSNQTLVAVPMFAGCVTIAAVWGAIALLVFRPTGANAHLAWPAAALVLGLALLQVGSWIPLVQSWLRVALVPIAIAAVPLCSLMLSLFVSEAVLAAILLAPLPLLYASGVHFVAKARCGDTYDWRTWRRLVERIAEWRRPAQHAFRSADRAQIWFEWRGHGWFLPLTLGPIILVTVPFLQAVDRSNPEAGWRLVGILAVMPMLFAMIMGGQVGRQDMWTDYPMTPFLAARPISTLRLVAAKFWMCLGSTLVAFALTVLGIVMLLLRPGFAAHAAEVAQAIGVWKSIAIVAGASAILVAITWLQMAANAWMSLTGRTWLINAVAFTFSGLVGIGALAGVWIYLHEALHVYVQAAAPWVMRAMLVIKALTAVAVLAGLLRTKLLRTVDAAAIVSVWCLVAGGLWLTAWWLLPTGAAPLPTLAAGIALLVPFSRLVGAPLALSWNRHR